MPTGTKSAIGAVVRHLAGKDEPSQPGTIGHGINQGLRELRERSLNDATRMFARACFMEEAGPDESRTVVTD